MVRNSLILLVGLSVLLCPLRCAVSGQTAAPSVSSAAASMASSVGSSCGCCHGQPVVDAAMSFGGDGSDWNSEAPANDPRPDDGCGCGDCICHGAVVEAADREPVAAASLGGGPIESADIEWIAESRSISLDGALPPPVARPSGRQLRIELSSFLN